MAGVPQAPPPPSNLGIGMCPPRRSRAASVARRTVRSTVDGRAESGKWVRGCVTKRQRFGRDRSRRDETCVGEACEACSACPISPVTIV